MIRMKGIERAVRSRERTTCYIEFLLVSISIRTLKSISVYSRKPLLLVARYRLASLAPLCSSGLSWQPLNSFRR